MSGGVCLTVVHCAIVEVAPAVLFLVDVCILEKVDHIFIIDVASFISRITIHSGGSLLSRFNY